MSKKQIFFDDLLGLISAAKLIAKARNVSLAEASDFLDSLLVSDGTMIYTKVDGHQVDELGAAWYSPACDYVTEALSVDWWNRAEMLEVRLSPGGYLRDELAITCIDAVRLLDIVAPTSQHTAGSINDAVLDISGQTLTRLQRAIAAFPARYPSYKERAPKLDDDIRPWLKEAGLAENEAERRVFGTIIREHFELLPDTQKTK